VKPRALPLNVAFACVCALLGGMLAEPSLAVQRPSTGLPQAPRNQVTIPARPTKPVFRGQGEQWSSDISFDRQTRTVTVRLSVEDPQGYFIPNLRRENFAVYESDVKQTNVTVEIEHAPVTLAVLLEGGGRYQQLNGLLRTEIPLVIGPLRDALGHQDKVAVFAYADRVEMLIPFDQPFTGFDRVLDRLKTPGFSEANLFDALIDVLHRMKDVGGRKAVLLISTGLDTFSHATFDDVLHAAQQSATPVYSIGLGERVRSLAGSVISTTGSLSAIDWKRAEQQLETLAKVSGGRAYVLDPTVEVPAIYDDIMEHLRVRYVITYVSSNPADTGDPRSVRVELVDAKTGAPLRIVDATGKVIKARVIAQGSYTP
jgi:Ca-activated chloride channel family protein